MDWRIVTLGVWANYDLSGLLINYPVLYAHASIPCDLLPLGFVPCLACQACGAE